MHGQIHCQYGTAFGGPVTFDNTFAEFVQPRGLGAVLKLLGSGNQIAQRVKIVGVRFSSVTREKSVRAEEKCAVQVVKSGRDDAIMERGQVQKRKQPPHQRQQQPYDDAETVKQRQRIENPVGFHQIDYRQRLTNVGEDVAVGQFDSFWVAFGAAGEENQVGFGALKVES